MLEPRERADFKIVKAHAVDKDGKSISDKKTYYIKFNPILHLVDRQKTEFIQAKFGSHLAFDCDGRPVIGLMKSLVLDERKSPGGPCSSRIGRQNAGFGEASNAALSLTATKAEPAFVGMAHPSKVFINDRGTATGSTHGSFVSPGRQMTLRRGLNTIDFVITIALSADILVLIPSG